MKNKKTNVFQDVYSEIYPEKKAMSITFIVTNQCNLRCSYCYEHNKNNNRMSFETAKKCVDLLFKMDEENHEYVNSEKADGLVLDFIGGEPLLEIELIDKIMDYFRLKAFNLNHRWATHYMINMSTNGLLYNTPEVQKFILKNKGRVSIGVTVDGDKETHDTCRLDCNGCGSYDRAIAAFKKVKEQLNLESTKFTIAPENVHRTFIACKDLIEKNNLEEMHCNCVYEEGWNNDNALVLYQQLKQLSNWMLNEWGYDRTEISILNKAYCHPVEEENTLNWCGGTGRMLAFDTDGTCYPCLRYAPLSVGENVKPLRIGDCDNGIAVLPEDKNTVNMLNSITRQSQSEKKCIECPIGQGCGWCSGYNYEIFGTPNKRATFICPTHIIRSCATAYYHNTAYKIGLTNEKYEFTCPPEMAIPIIGEEEYNMIKELNTFEEKE